MNFSCNYNGTHNLSWKLSLFQKAESPKIWNIETPSGVLCFAKNKAYLTNTVDYKAT
jgi:hypothetical protein